jgi:hypothetical protein
LAEAPVDAIQGLSEGDAEKLQEAFNVKSVRDLAENKFVRIAQAVVALSGSRQAKNRARIHSAATKEAR